jgi:hypothetical protein
LVLPHGRRSIETHQLEADDLLALFFPIATDDLAANAKMRLPPMMVCLMSGRDRQISRIFVKSGRSWTWEDLVHAIELLFAVIFLASKAKEGQDGKTLLGARG